MVALTKTMRWGMALRGVAAILFALLAFSWPGLTVLVLLILFGAYALVDGLFAIVGSIANRERIPDWWLVLLIGIFSVLVGVLAFASPAITALVLLLFIGARAMVTGIMEIAWALRLRHEIQGEWWLILGGVCSVVFGLLVFGYPFVGALAVVWLIAAYAFILGIAQVVFAVSARRLAEPYERPGAHPPVTA